MQNSRIADALLYRGKKAGKNRLVAETLGEETLEEA